MNCYLLKGFFNNLNLFIMAISYVDFQRYSQLAKEMEDLQQQLNDANLEGDTVRASFIEQKIVFNAQFLGIAVSYLVTQVHIVKSKD